MNTKSKKRIYVSVSSDMEDALELISKKNNTPVASAASILLEKAIEIEEDKIWDEIATKRKSKSKNKKFYSHVEAWK